jgi:hypothetical protein
LAVFSLFFWISVCTNRLAKSVLDYPLRFSYLRIFIFSKDFTNLFYNFINIL